MDGTRNRWSALQASNALRLGAGVLALTALAGLLWPGPFFFGYLSAVVFWMGVALGGAAFLLLHHLVGGRWGWPLRPLLASMTLTVLLTAVLFLPVLGGLRRLYPWTEPDQGSALLLAKQAYLNAPFFIVRTLGYLGLWCLGALVVARASQWRHGDGTRREGLAPRVGAVGLIVYVLTASFAGIDWVGSLEPEWYSSIFGLYVIIGQAVAALSVLILVRNLRGAQPNEVEHAVGPRQDLGNLMLTAIVLHAYFAFSQFLIIWNGNLPHEIGWFVPRIHGGWGSVAICMLLAHFVFPFAALLSRQVKRKEKALFCVAAVLLFACLVDTIWMIVPSYEGSAVAGAVFAILAWAGVGALWYWAFDRLERLRSGPKGAVAVTT